MFKFSTDLPTHERLIEALLTATVLAIFALMWFYYVDTPWLLHLYYLPVVLIGFFLGKSRARLLAMLSVLTATIIFVPNLSAGASSGIPLATILAFCLWIVTLITTAILVGSMSDRWRVAMHELRESHKKDVLVDPLTKIANRRAFEFELARRLAEYTRHGVPAALLSFDIDYFKSFNDRYGHQAGDAVLRDVAQSLVESVRDTDLVARCGGEEFSIILPGADSAHAKEIAERARNLVEATRFVYNGLTLRLTVSVGVACITDDDDAEQITSRSDAALYQSKESGRNCSHIHDGIRCRKFGNGVAKETSESLKSTEVAGVKGELYTDPTTGMPAVKVFLEELRRRTAEAHRYGGKFCVAIVKINEYLSVDDKDARAQKSLIATVAQLTTSVLREPDLVVRYDKDLLAIMMPATTLERSLIPLQRLRKKADEYREKQYPSLSYGVTIGVVQLEEEDSAGSLLQRAESAYQHAAESHHEGVGVSTQGTLKVVCGEQLTAST
ncbi:diguanylate cyclase [Adhaeretor mobilis]|uniref:diguanylate cyclase n=1 Tax=Adhaeretor mobilis TaxID=1930276 RepID=A0A517MWT6_9BACT|nr:diguanylate cyclase [Adhaeretor mobilis]QDS99342.1 putative diguanylate cyclase YedQ [Adhaeretor mobilis]